MRTGGNPSLHLRSFHQGTVGIGKRIDHIAARAAERALLAWLHVAEQYVRCFLGREVGLRRYGRCFVDKAHPLAVLSRQVLSLRNHVVVCRHQVSAQVLALFALNLWWVGCTGVAA